jgi:hypothetical protein
MTYITKTIPKLRKTAQPPLRYPGAAPDSDRAKRPPLADPAVTPKELNPGDPVEGLGNFGKPTREFGTVEQTNEMKLSSNGTMTVVRDSASRG